MNLRPYQIDAVNGLRDSFKNGNRKVILCAPTGSGKTFIFCYLAKLALEKDGKILILTDRVELMRQSNGSLTKLGLDAEEIKAGHKPNLVKNLHVAMVETLYRRAEKYKSFINSRTLVVVDEAHKTAHQKILDLLPENCYVVGATATPYRSGQQQSLDAFYDDIVQTVDIPDLVSQGFLSEPRSFGVDVDLSGVKKKAGDWDSNELGKRYSERKVYRGVIDNYKRITPNTKAIAFTPNVASSQELCDKFNSVGIAAKHLDGSMGKNERESVLDWFDKLKGEGVLCNCSVLTTGFDQPDIETVILYRATTSLPLFLQMVGRGSRVVPGVKSEFTILDFGNNIRTHDFWESPREWGLEKVVKKRKQDVAPVRICQKCGAMVPATSVKCKYCGHERKQTKKEKKEAEIAVLVELPKRERMNLAAKATVPEKVEMCKNKLVSSAWVLHNMTSKEDALEFVNLMGYKKGFVHINKNRFKVFQ